jgi:hypothetical protein
MSKRETPLTLAYWEHIKGTLIEEYPIVNKGKDCSPRWIDALIIKDGDYKKLPERTDLIDLSGLDVICVQTKSRRVGMYLLGQAFFSMKLLEMKNPKSILSIALCTQTDSYMEKIIEDIPNLKIQVINPDTLELL